MDTYKEYIVFRQIFENENAKTGVWQVKSRNHGFLLGFIRWNGQWRQYCFFPEVETVWSEGCLRDLVEFMKQNKHYRVPDLVRQENKMIAKLEDMTPEIFHDPESVI